jgi:hypothetical protein
MHEERKEKLEGTIRKNVENYKRILEGDNLWIIKQL